MLCSLVDKYNVPESCAAYMFFLIITIIIYLFILTANGFLPGGSGTAIRHNTQITHHSQTKHSTKNSTNNKGYTTHN
jgi:hypothetical protein